MHCQIVCGQKWSLMHLSFESGHEISLSRLWYLLMCRLSVVWGPDWNNRNSRLLRKFESVGLRTGFCTFILFFIFVVHLFRPAARIHQRLVAGSRSGCTSFRYGQLPIFQPCIVYWLSRVFWPVNKPFTATTMANNWQCPGWTGRFTICFTISPIHLSLLKRYS